MTLEKMGMAARLASLKLKRIDADQKNRALYALARLLRQEQALILQASSADFATAKASGMSEAMLDRLSLEGRIEGLARDVEQIASMQDPIGQSFEHQQLPNGLKVYKMRTSLGVLGVIYEARPNVTIDVAALAIKTSNAVILRGGKEILRVNQVLIDLVHQALSSAGLSVDMVQLIEQADRAYVLDMLHLYEYIDVIIPRGGPGLHKFCRENSRIPVITGGIGICHLFVDKTADLQAAIRVVHNAKVQRPTVCNALDTLLVHEDVAEKFLPRAARALIGSHVSLRCDKAAYEILSPDFKESVALALTEDFETEWLSLVLGVKVVKDLQEAIAHIEHHGSGHSDGILTKDKEHAKRFVQEVDSAAVYINASTRFTDGSQLGLGAEVAISTQKLHARGPMGLPELTSYKWVIEGEGHVRP